MSAPVGHSYGVTPKPKNTHARAPSESESEAEAESESESEEEAESESESDSKPVPEPYCDTCHEDVDLDDDDREDQSFLQDSHSYHCTKCHHGFDSNDQTIEFDVNEHTVEAQVDEFVLTECESDPDGGAGDAVIEITVPCPHCRENQMQVRVCTEFTFRLNPKTWKIATVSEIGVVNLVSPLAELSTTIDHTLAQAQWEAEHAEQAEADMTAMLTSEFQAWQLEQRPERGMLIQASKDPWVPSDAHRSIAQAAAAEAQKRSQAQPTGPNPGEQRWAVFQDKVRPSMYMRSSVMYHNAAPAARDAIVTSRHLRATRADDAHYDYELQTDPRAPKVVFTMLNVYGGKPNDRTNYPRGYSGVEPIPRFDFSLHNCLNPDAFYWYFLGFSFPYTKPNAPAIPRYLTVQVHVVLVERDREHTEWCSQRLARLHPDPAHVLLRLVQAKQRTLNTVAKPFLEIPHKATVVAGLIPPGCPPGTKPSRAGQHTLTFNVAYAGNLQFDAIKTEEGSSTHWNAVSKTRPAAAAGNKKQKL